MNTLKPYAAPYSPYLFLYAQNLLKTCWIFKRLLLVHIFLYTLFLFMYQTGITGRIYNALKSLNIFLFSMLFDFWHTPCSIRLYMHTEMKQQYQRIQLKKGGVR